MLLRRVLQPSFLLPRANASSASGKRTSLYQLHVDAGGRMVPFAGWEMPGVYADLSLTDSVHHTRNSASLFDVSHMLQTHIHGKDRVGFMESLVTGDLAGLAENTGTLTVFTNEAGGIEDDLIVTNTPDRLYVVSNAGCAHKDLPYMMDKASEWRSQGKDVTVEELKNQGLLALQGPAMRKVLKPEGLDLDGLYFMQTAEAVVCGIPVRITRCGYTGEDGVELSVDPHHAPQLAERLLHSKEVKWAGLGARDALRLEAGLCLYGSDMDPTTTPVEAVLAWLIAKPRRTRADFPGASLILAQLKDKSYTRRRVGLSAQGGRPSRPGVVLLSEAGEEVGIVTSGSPSPTLGANIAMGYVQPALSKPGTPLLAKHKGGKTTPIQVTKMPFVPTHYYLPPKK